MLLTPCCDMPCYRKLSQMLTCIFFSMSGTWYRGSNARCMFARLQERSSSCEKADWVAMELMVVWHGVLVHCFSIAWLAYIRC